LRTITSGVGNKCLKKRKLGKKGGISKGLVRAETSKGPDSGGGGDRCGKEVLKGESIETPAAVADRI